MLQVKAKPGLQQKVKDNILTLFPTSSLTEAHEELLVFHLLPTNNNINNNNTNNDNNNTNNDGGDSNSGEMINVFNVMEEMSDIVAYFGISQTTLEQVFLKLVQDYKKT